MEHPLRHPRLFEVGEAEGPAGVGWIDNVADAEGHRLPPHDALIPNVSRQWACLVFPPGVTHLVVVVVAIHEMTEARMIRAGGTPCRVIRAVEGIRRFVNEPFAREKT